MQKNTTQITPPPVTPSSFTETSLKVNGINSGFTHYAVNTSPVIKFSFSASIDHNTVTDNISLKKNTGATVSLATSYEDGDSTVVVKPLSALSFITRYAIGVGTGLKSKQGTSLQSAVNATLVTSIDGLAMVR